MLPIVPYMKTPTLIDASLPLAAIKTFADLKSSLGTVIGLLILFAYVAALVLYIAGVMKKNSDPSGATDSIKTAAWLAAGTTIVTVLFVAFGNSGAVVDANFN